MERVSLARLQSMILEKEGSFTLRAIVGPIIYQLDDKYYNAAIEYLKNNIKTEIVESDVSASDVMEHMECTYLEALCILNNIRNYPNQVSYIMNYNIIE